MLSAGSRYSAVMPFQKQSKIDRIKEMQQNDNLVRKYLVRSLFSHYMSNIMSAVSLNFS